MQVKKTAIEKRSRYYHSTLDMFLLRSGVDYGDLSDTYVIFICDYDPFGRSSCRYRIDSRCLEFPDLEIADGRHTIVLNNRGCIPSKSEEDVPEELVRFLEYTRKPVEESEYDSGDNYVDQLQESIRRIKGDRETEGRYMTLQTMLMDERREGREEGIMQVISIYRDEMYLDDAAIKDKIISKFRLSEEEAEYYISQAEIV